jgi:hypothetical protein
MHSLIAITNIIKYSQLLQDPSLVFLHLALAPTTSDKATQLEINQ